MLTQNISDQGSFRLGAVPNYVELGGVTVTARSVGNLAPENLLTPMSPLRYQSVEVSDQLDGITLSWDRPRWVTDVVLHDHNLSPEATVQVVLSESLAISSDIVRTPFLPPPLVGVLGDAADSPGPGYTLAGGATLPIFIGARGPASISQVSGSSAFRMRARSTSAGSFSTAITIVGSASSTTTTKQFHLMDAASHLLHIPFDPVALGIGEAGFDVSIENTGSGDLVVEGVDAVQEWEESGVHRSPWHPVWPDSSSTFLGAVRSAATGVARSYHCYLSDNPTINPEAVRAVSFRIRDGLHPDHHFSARGVLAGGHLRGGSTSEEHSLGDIPQVSLIHQEDGLTSLGGAEFIFPGRIRRRFTIPIVSSGEAGLVEIFDGFLRRQRRPVAVTLFPGSSARDVLTIVGRTQGEEHLADYSDSTPDRTRQEITIVEI